jgi:hypothetical protein
VVFCSLAYPGTKWYILGMDKKEFMKAFLTGVCSIFPFFDGFPEFNTVEIDKDLIEAKKSQVPPVKVLVRPVFDDVGDCFNDAGEKLRSSMREITEITPCSNKGT